MKLLAIHKSITNLTISKKKFPRIIMDDQDEDRYLISKKYI